MNENNVARICKAYRIENWSINTDGLVVIDGNVKLNFKGLTELPLQFGRVTGDFFCHENDLTTLEGAPKEVGGGFYCYSNKLITLKWAPEYIDGKVEFLSNSDLPREFIIFLELNSNRIDLQTYIIKWQKDYAVWRRDGSFNQANFIQMMQDAEDELENIKFPK